MRNKLAFVLTFYLVIIFLQPYKHQIIQRDNEGSASARIVSETVSDLFLLPFLAAGRIYENQSHIWFHLLLPRFYRSEGMARSSRLCPRRSHVPPRRIGKPKPGTTSQLNCQLDRGSFENVE